MSGIFGVHYFDDRLVKPKVLQQMSDTLAHRGSDGTDIWCCDRVGLGHRLLWTTPESLLEKQPLASDDNNSIVTADARIDNREELIFRLGLSEFPAEKITDINLILKAYNKWGEKCPQELLGDFAFAIWDKREQHLFCARDHFGVKPFYYSLAEEDFFFASEIKALLAVCDFAPELNESKIGDYLISPMLEDKQITIYENVYRLPPAHCAVVSGDRQIRLNSYWSLDSSVELKLNSDREYADKFREIFIEAIQCRLRTAFPIGTHLSGGLDSSSVTSVALNLLAKHDTQLHTFSNIFDDVPECDEREFIDRVLELGGSIPHYIHADRSSPFSEREDFFRYFDEPFVGHSHFLVRGLNRSAQQAGVRITLDGFDGDTTVSHGEEYFVELARQGNWQKFVAEAKSVAPRIGSSAGTVLQVFGFPYLVELAKNHRWIAFFKAVNGIERHFFVSRKTLILRYGIKPHVPQTLLNWRDRLEGRKPKPNRTNDFLNPNFVSRVESKQNKKGQKKIKPRLATVRENQLNAFNSGLFVHVLELVDLGAAGYSIEARHPFMDKRLIEFCLSLPPEQKLDRGWTRAIMRRAMKGILPPEIQWRGGKTSMKANFDRGFYVRDRQFIEEVLSQNTVKAEKFIDINSLRQSFKSYLASGKFEDDKTIPIFQGVILSYWLDRIYPQK